MLRASRLPILAALASVGYASTPLTGQVTIAGVVIEAATRQPVGGALVVLDTTQQVTSPDGRFRFAAVSPGRRTLRTSHVAYAERLETIDVREGDAIELRILLAAEAIRLDPMSVEVRSQRLLDAGFYERAARGIGLYIHPEQLRESRALHLSDFLARVPGVRRALVNGEESRMDLRGGRSVYLTCETQYFLDGASIRAGAAILDNLVPSNVAGIEIYRGASETPIQFDHGGAACGAIVIWTRRN